MDKRSKAGFQQAPICVCVNSILDDTVQLFQARLDGWIRCLATWAGARPMHSSNLTVCLAHRLTGSEGSMMRWSGCGQVLTRLHPEVCSHPEATCITRFEQFCRDPKFRWPVHGWGLAVQMFFWFECPGHYRIGGASRSITTMALSSYSSYYNV